MAASISMRGKTPFRSFDRSMIPGITQSEEEPGEHEQAHGREKGQPDRRAGERRRSTPVRRPARADPFNIIPAHETTLRTAAPERGGRRPQHGRKDLLVGAMLYRRRDDDQKVDDGRPTDFDAEEIDRKISINLAVAHAVHRDTASTSSTLPVTASFLRRPGPPCTPPTPRSSFSTQDLSSKRPSGPGSSPANERPVLFVVNRMDRERASFDRVVESLRKKFGRSTCRSRFRSAKRRRSGNASTSSAWSRTSTREASAWTADPAGPGRPGEGRARGARRGGRRGRGRPHGEVLRAGHARGRRTSCRV